MVGVNSAKIRLVVWALELTFAKNLCFVRFCTADVKDTFLMSYIRNTVEDFKSYFIKTVQASFSLNMG